MVQKLPPVTPGEILLEEFMKPLAVSQNKLARDLDLPPARVNDIIHARRGISANTALRLAAYFGTTPEFWLNLQSAYDLKLEQRKSGAALRRVIRRRVSSAVPSKIKRPVNKAKTYAA